MTQSNAGRSPAHRWIQAAIAAVLTLGASSSAYAADMDAKGPHMEPIYFVFWGIMFVAALAALVQAFLFYKAMVASDPGTARMIEIAGYVKTGANAYLRQQYKIVAVFFVVIFALLAYAAFGSEGAKRLGAVCVYHRWILLGSCRLVWHEDRHAGQQSHRSRRAEIAEPRFASCVSLGCGDGLDRRRLRACSTSPFGLRVLYWVVPHGHRRGHEPDRHHGHHALLWHGRQ